MKKYNHYVSHNRIRVFGNPKTNGGYEDLRLYVDAFYLKSEIKNSAYPKVIFRITVRSFELIGSDIYDFGYALKNPMQRTYWFNYGMPCSYNSLHGLLKNIDKVWVPPSTIMHIFNNPEIRNTIDEFMEKRYAPKNSQ